MRFRMKMVKSVAVFAFMLSLLPLIASAQHYTQTNLVSDVPGMAPNIDSNLKNPWGLTRSADGSPWWVAN